MADLDTLRSDKNPPTLLSLNVLGSGEPSDTIAPFAPAEVRFRVQDDGELGEVFLFYRDGGDWSKLVPAK